jgi:formate--tetrahydrofolate ligase
VEKKRASSKRPQLDPTKLKDWQIAEAAEETMKPVSKLAKEMGLRESELIPMGRKLAKVDYQQALARLDGRGLGQEHARIVE